MATATGALRAGQTSQQRPNHTLYCINLPDKLRKDDLKRALYMLFSTYGPVLDIVAVKTPRMRGQAHVLFRDVQASTQALRALQGYEFFGKEMRISYAKSKSDTLAKLDGSYKQPVGPIDAQASATQQSIFAGPPGTTNSNAPGPPPQAVSSTGLEPPPARQTQEGRLASPSDTATPGSQGVKRARDESEAEDDDAPMEMEDAAMDESDDE